MTRLISSFGTIDPANASPVFQLALDHAAATGEPLEDDYIGERIFLDPLTYYPAVPEQFPPGLILRCSGADRLTYKKMHSGHFLTLDSQVDNSYQRGSWISGFTVLGEFTGAGIYFRRQWKLNIDDVVCQNLENGIHTYMVTGDADGSNRVNIRNSEFNNCSKWGFFGETVPGRNELSFLDFFSCVFHACGRNEGNIGGGLRWKGQQLSVRNSYFTECKNRGYYADGGAGTATQAYFQNVTFENGSGKHVEIHGGLGYTFDTCDFYSTAYAPSLVPTHSVWVSTQTPLAGHIRIINPKVRCNPLYTPHTAFYAVTPGNDVSVAGARWDQYDALGQTRTHNFVSIYELNDRV